MTTAAKRIKTSAEERPLEIAVRPCSGHAEFATCIEIERAVWGSADVDIVPLPLFVVAAETGGQVLGAFAGERMVGFTLAIAGVRNRKPFLHSHMTAVLQQYRNQGAGRGLKLLQRQEALARGIDLIEWTFDPLEIKNAYFNFRLGAIARRFIPNMYGTTTSPLAWRLAHRPADRGMAAAFAAREPGFGRQAFVLEKGAQERAGAGQDSRGLRSDSRHESRGGGSAAS